MSAADANRELAERGDLDELVRHVDRLGDARDWAALLDLRQRCEWALTRGRQLWPIRSLIEYRLALFAPGEVAGTMVGEGTGHLALGPLTEVAAQHHRWADLEPHIGPGPARAFCAHERVIRGEALAEDDLDGSGLDIDVLDLRSPCNRGSRPTRWPPTDRHRSSCPDRTSPPWLRRSSPIRRPS